MPTLQQIRQQVDDALAGLWPTIQAKQEQYASNHNGRYWQGLLTHRAALPADGDTDAPDVGTDCPTDQPGDPWPAAIRNAPLPMALQMDVYDGPLGTGYQAIVYVKAAGNIYARSAQVGPENWRGFNWVQVG